MCWSECWEKSGGRREKNRADGAGAIEGRFPISNGGSCVRIVKKGQGGRGEDRKGIEGQDHN